MNKILIFISLTIAGMHLASFFSLVIRFSPGLKLGFVFLLAAAVIVSAIIAWFAPSTRPWIALGVAIIGIGGFFAWLL